MKKFIKFPIKFCITIFSVILFNLAINVPSFAVEWKVDKEKSKLEYSVKVQANPLKGSFSQFDAKIKLDPEMPSDGSIEVIINTNSITTGNSQGDSLVKNLEWLNIENFSQAKFMSTSIEKTEQDNYKAIGDLLIREISVPATLEFTLNVSGNNATAIGKAVISRTEFKVGPQSSSNMPVDETVNISFEIHANR